MEDDLPLCDACLRDIEQMNALVHYVRQAGMNALNEYQKDKFLNLTVRQVMLIATVQRMSMGTPCPGVPLSTLARELHMSASAASHLVSSLEEHNLLTRLADEDDRRSVRVCLSESGRKCAGVARRGMMKAINALTAQLSAEENDERMRVTEKLYRAAYPNAV